MAIKVTPVSEAGRLMVEGAKARADRYGTNTPAAAQDYVNNTIAAASTYKAAVSATNIDKMFSGGVQTKGARKFAANVTSKGVQRYPGGVETGRSEYEQSVGPFLDTIKGITLPQKKVRGDPANQARSTIIQVELHKKRLSLRGA